MTESSPFDGISTSAVAMARMALETFNLVYPEGALLTPAVVSKK